MRKKTEAPKRRRIRDWLVIGFVVLCFAIACYPYLRAPTPQILTEGTLELRFIDQNCISYVSCIGRQVLYH